ncbi:hypothetical protein [Streptomyces fructofermentans]|uniref:Lipoprotein n=1 Tax=Streptomyces fructofermentans TaxID=152141 RepID=A0A918U628_9ACTN|nr:hypothetical protein [Streptomyces fructofermentans]GGX97551.1 hypothetical protein GCM10010515_74990 [Streptomyces fructofermentans]
MCTRRRIAVLCAALLTLAGCGHPQDTHRDSSRTGSSKSPRPGAVWRYDHTGSDTNASFADIAAASADDAWAVGKSPVTGWVDEQETLLFHYDGKAWRPYDLPPALRRLDELPIVRLDASGPRDVWLFAGISTTPEKSSPPLAAHWDGTAWQAVEVPRDFPQAVVGAAVFGPSDAWVVDGSDTARHWDGRQWRTSRLPGRAQALAGTSGRDLWAAGSALTREAVARPVAAHWDGGGWRKAEMPALSPRPKEGPYDSALARVVALSADDVRAFGTVSSEGGDTDAYSAGFALRWDGSRWSEETGVPCCAKGAAGDVIVLSPERYLTAAGEEERIARPPCLSDRPGKQGRGGCREKLQLEDFTAVPGSGQVWGVGSVRGREAAARPVVVRFTPAP